MRYSIIDGRMRAFEKAFVRGLGYELIEVPKSTRVYPEISSHVDIFAGKIQNRIVAEESFFNTVLFPIKPDFSRIF